MPTSLLAKQAAGAAVSVKNTKRLPLQSPWAGYTPDMAVPAEQPSGLQATRALIVSSGVLTPDHGWEQIGAVNLPLGNNDRLEGWTDGVVAYGAGMLSATNEVNALGDYRIQPVRHLAGFQRFSSAAGLGNLLVLAITADTNGPDSSPVPRKETGHLFRFRAGNWEAREFQAYDGALAIIVGEVPLTGGVDDWVDSTVYPLGVTGGETNNGGTQRYVQPVSEAVFIFTNHLDEVMYFPSADNPGLGGLTGGTSHYSSFSAYCKQITDTGTNATGFYQAPEFTSLKAKSIATFDGRVWYANTVEGGSSHHATRLRRSIVGNPFIVWPGFEIDDSTPGLNLNGVGAGFIDLEQFQQPILRILPLGDLLAVYSEDGVAVLRRTGSQAAPYAVQYITLDRGLISPGAVLAISPAKHFALLTDGWYIINANGTLQEVGLSAPQPLRTGEINYKWKTDFYTRYDRAASDNGHIQMGYEPEEQFVRISVPMDGGGSYTDNAPTEFTIANEVWIYDLKNDRVFLDDYSGVNNQNQSPLVWSVVVRPPGDSVSWDEVTAGTATPWDALDDPGSWASLIPTSGAQIVVHGDTNGKAYFHDHATVTRDGDAPTWSFTTVPHNYKIAGAGERVLQRVDVQYENNQADTTATASITATTYSNDSGEDTTAGVSEASTISLQRGTSGQMAQDYANFRLTGDHHQISMSGEGQVKIHSIDLEIQMLQGRYRRKEGT